MNLIKIGETIINLDNVYVHKDDHCQIVFADNSGGGVLVFYVPDGDYYTQAQRAYEWLTSQCVMDFNKPEDTKTCATCGDDLTKNNMCMKCDLGVPF